MPIMSIEEAATKIAETVHDGTMNQEISEEKRALFRLGKLLSPLIVKWLKDEMETRENIPPVVINAWVEFDAMILGGIVSSACLQMPEEEAMYKLFRLVSNLREEEWSVAVKEFDRFKTYIEENK